MTRQRDAVPWRLRWAAMLYLLLVFGVAIFVFIATFLRPPGDASFASIWLILVAFPASLIPLTLMPSLSGPGSFALLVAVGLGQAVVVFLLCWWLDRRLR
jgi:hypothetical protein